MAEKFLQHIKVQDHNRIYTTYVILYKEIKYLYLYFAQCALHMKYF